MGDKSATESFLTILGFPRGHDITCSDVEPAIIGNSLTYN